MKSISKAKKKMRCHERVVITYRRNYGAALNVAILYYLRGKDSVKEFLYQLFTFLFTKSQAGNNLIREFLCLSVQILFAAKSY